MSAQQLFPDRSVGAAARLDRVLSAEQIGRLEAVVYGTHQEQQQQHEGEVSTWEAAAAGAATERCNEGRRGVGAGADQQSKGKGVSSAGGWGGGSMEEEEEKLQARQTIRGSAAAAAAALTVRPSGGKDRHSKVRTAKGLRDRRVRLSAPTAIQFFDVQDRLGYDQPSKAVDWLMRKARAAIEELAPAEPGAAGPPNLGGQPAENSVEEPPAGGAAPVLAGARAESRAKARERARERAKERAAPPPDAPPPPLFRHPSAPPALLLPPSSCPPVPFLRLPHATLFHPYDLLHFSSASAAPFPPTPPPPASSVSPRGTLQSIFHPPVPQQLLSQLPPPQQQQQPPQAPLRAPRAGYESTTAAVFYAPASMPSSGGGISQPQRSASARNIPLRIYGMEDSDGEPRMMPPPSSTSMANFQ